MRFLLTDAQIIERIRKARRYRRPLGAVCAALGVAGVLVGLWLLHKMEAQSTALFQEFARYPNPSTQQSIKFLDEVSFSSGLAIGFSFAVGLSGACSLAVSGFVWLLVKNRCDTLLLNCWDRST